MNKISKRLLTFTLAVSIVGVSLSNTNVYAAKKFEAATTTEFNCKDTDGNYSCKLQVSEDKKSFQLDKTNTDTDEKTTIVYEDDIATTYKTTTNSVLGYDFTKEKKVSEVDFSEAVRAVENSFTTQGYGDYNICAIPTLAGNNLWYMIGNSKPDVGYMKMGCDWTYRVKTEACDACSSFRANVRNCNISFAAAGGGSLALRVAIAIMGIGGTGGLSLAVGYGMLAGQATAIVAACDFAKGAHEDYDIAKGYGKVIDK